MSKDHPAITSPVSRHLVVSDVAKSIAFYCNVLGFNEASDPAKSNTPSQAAVTCGPARIQFYTEEGLALDSSGPMSPHGSAMLFFEVDNVQLTQATIAARGGQPSTHV